MHIVFVSFLNVRETSEIFGCKMDQNKIGWGGGGGGGVENEGNQILWSISIFKLYTYFYICKIIFVLNIIHIYYWISKFYY